MRLPETFGPQFIVDLMNECWKEDPHERPAFKVIFILNFKKKKLIVKKKSKEII